MISSLAAHGLKCNESLQHDWISPSSKRWVENEVALHWSLARHGLTPSPRFKTYRNLPAAELLKRSRSVALLSVAGGSSKRATAIAADEHVRVASATRLESIRHQIVERYFSLGHQQNQFRLDSLYVVDGAIGSHVANCVPLRVVCDHPSVALGLTYLVERLPAGTLGWNRFEPELIAYIASGFSMSNAMSSAPPDALAMMTPDGTRLYAMATTDVLGLREALATAASTVLASARKALEPQDSTVLCHGTVVKAGSIVLGKGADQFLWDRTGISRAWRATRLEWNTEKETPESADTSREAELGVVVSMDSASKKRYLVPAMSTAIPNQIAGTPHFFIPIPDGSPISGVKDVKRATKSSNRKATPRLPESTEANIPTRTFTVQTPEQLAFYALAANALPVATSTQGLAAQQFSTLCAATHAKATLVVGPRAHARALELAQSAHQPTQETSIPPEWIHHLKTGLLTRHPSLSTILTQKNTSSNQNQDAITPLSRMEST